MDAYDILIKRPIASEPTPIRSPHDTDSTDDAWEVVAVGNDTVRADRFIDALRLARTWQLANQRLGNIYRQDCETRSPVLFELKL